MRRPLMLLVVLAVSSFACAGDGNRLSYLDSNEVWYPHKDFPKLITPQWVGEEGVECVVTLAIDDMRDPAKYEAYLRPILQRLKQIDGRAPVSIMTNSVKPDDPQLQSWLQEGLSIECHTFDHPCPILQSGVDGRGLKVDGQKIKDDGSASSPSTINPQPSTGLLKAKATYDKCVDLMASIPNNKPVAFRTPCCDSLNTVSPRLFSEIITKTTPAGNFLQLDSSVFTLYTADDTSIPRELLYDPDGKEKFRKYIPRGFNYGGVTHSGFVNLIENYPYPYVVQRTCWEFPCVVPSDWSAQHLHKPNNPDTVRDWKAALDITVLKQGVFNLVFHPHNWIKPEQVVELIDHAVTKHGKKVKFLTFKECVERLNKNVLRGSSLREEDRNTSEHVLLDINGDGIQDAIQFRGSSGKCSIWQQESNSWRNDLLPFCSLGQVKDTSGTDHRGSVSSHTAFGILSAKGRTASVSDGFSVMEFEHHSWAQRLPDDIAELAFAANDESSRVPPIRSTRLRDLDQDSVCELLTIDSNERLRVDRWSSTTKRFTSVPSLQIPSNVPNLKANGSDVGLRFIDLNEDGHDDLVFANNERFGAWLFESMEQGWSIELLNVKRGEGKADVELPPIVREDGSDNGFFVKDRHLCWINEDTSGLPDFIQRVTFDKLLGDRLPDAKSPEAAKQSMRVAPGYRVDLVAHEPLTMDPVALDFGPDGKLWVAEMADYPNGIPDDEADPNVSADSRRAATVVPSPPSSGERARVRGPSGEETSGPATVSSKTTNKNGKTDSTISPPHPNPLPPKAGGEGTKPEKTKRAGRIRYLEDTNSDGVYDKSTLFMDGVPFPNGVLSWKKGVLVSAAPDIFYAEDTDGDGKADVKHILFTGFAEGNQQHRANGFVRGLDNWLYLANGDSGGSVACVQSLNDVISGSPRPGSAGRGAGGEGIRGGTTSQSRQTKQDGKGEEPLTLSLSPQSRGEGTKPKAERKPTDIRGRDIRIRPDTGEIEAISGQTQFGRNRDDWGNWFGNNNSRPMWHYVLDDHYLRRNPHLVAPNGQKDVSVAPGAAPVFPSSQTLTRFNDFHTANRFTSACSAMVDRGGLMVDGQETSSAPSSLPSTINHQPSTIFISEPVHNLVHREVMTPDGLSFTSQRHVNEQQSEFLASTDNWFRPTQLKTGPDGALYVADMYRLVIEHPEWIPIAWQRKLDLRAGHDKGRIWRVAPVQDGLVTKGGVAGAGALREAPETTEQQTGASPKAAPAPATRWRLDKMTTAELVATLNSPNGWQRDLAQQLLIDRADPTATPLLREKVIAGGRRVAGVGAPRETPELADTQTGASPKAAPAPATQPHTQALARLHALCTLDGLKDGLTVPVVVAGLKDEHPGVRRQAIRLCEKADLPKEGLVEHLVALVDDSDPQVRMQLAYTLGEIRSTRADAALGKLAAKASGQPWMMAAVLSSLRADNLPAVMSEAIAAAPDDTALLQQLLAQATAFKNDEAVIALLNRVTEPSPDGDYARWQLIAMEQFGLALERRTDKFNPFTKIPEGLQLIKRLEAMSAAVKKLATNGDANLSDREVAVRLLRLDSDAAVLQSLLVPQQPPSLQSAAITALGRMKRPEVAKELLGVYRSLAPGLRAEAASVLLSRDEWRDSLLSALEAKTFGSTDLDATSRQRLLDHKTKEVRERAAKLLAVDLNTNRAKLVAEYLPMVRAGGDVQHGRQLFTKRCAQCHKLGNEGHSVGPDLASLTDKSHEALLTAILDPNRAVESKFLTFTAVTKSGVTHIGLIANESATSLTLRAAEAKETSLLRNELDELQSTTKSLMPEGLEKEVTPTDAASLIAYIRNNVPLLAAKKFPGNEPAVVKPNADGSFTLSPFTAEIYGPTIVIEEKYKNLGWWSSAEDHVIWTMQVPKPGRYTVSWTFACEPSAAGETAIIEAAGKSIRHKVTATASWDDYQTATLGELELPAGEVRLTVKPASRPLPAMADVKSVKLSP